MMAEKKCVALNYASRIHYNDHLAPISVVMGIPILVVDQVDNSVCKQYYPETEIIFMEYHDFNPEYLIQNYDAIFDSDLWDRRVFKEKFHPFELKYGKRIRNVHVPHGFSDKNFYLKKSAMEDITLIYGQNMLDMLKEEGVLELLNAYVRTGNYRYTYYMRHQAFFTDIIEKEVLSHFDKKRKVILYAPTWMDLEESTTFFDSIGFILDDIPEEYNVIVKPHPRLELDDTAGYYQILGKYKDHPRIHFLTEFPLVYPILEITDIYIGDMSSIGYDFLLYNRPMFFLNKRNLNLKTQRQSFLYRCGVDIKKHQFSRLYAIIESHLKDDDEKYGKIRADLYDYTFGKERPFEEIKAEILAKIDE